MTYAQGEPAESRSWLERAIALAGPTPSAQLSDAHFAASALAQVQGDFACSTEHATHSLEIARAAAYPFGEGRALLGLGISAEWDHDLDLAEQRYRAAQLKTTATVKEPVIAPIKAGQALGELTVSDGKDVIARVPLVAQAAVPEGGWWTRMVDGISLWME